MVRVRRVGDRLRATLRDLVASFPAHAQAISGMSRWLDLPKATCQRVVEGLGGTTDGAAAMLRLPGVEGLRRHARAARRHGAPAPLVDAVLAAVGEYEALIRDTGGSQRRLIDFVAAARTGTGEMAPEDRRIAETNRRALFDAARKATGEEVDGKSVIAIVRPDREDASALTQTVSATLVGVRRQRFARPIVPFILSGWWAHLPEADRDAVRPRGVSAEAPRYALLREFSTANLRTVCLEQGDARTLLVTDVDGAEGEGGWMGPSDVSVLFESRAGRAVRRDHGWGTDFAVRIANPCRALVHDVYVHRSLRVEGEVLGGCFSLAAPPGDSPGGWYDQAWYERLPEAVEVRSLGMGVIQAPCKAYARQGELAASLFEQAGEDPGEYVAMRIEVAFPMWQTEYRTYVQYTTAMAEPKPLERV